LIARIGIISGVCREIDLIEQINAQVKATGRIAVIYLGEVVKLARRDELYDKSGRFPRKTCPI